MFYNVFKRVFSGKIFGRFHSKNVHVYIWHGTAIDICTRFNTGGSPPIDNGPGLLLGPTGSIYQLLSASYPPLLSTVLHYRVPRKCWQFLFMYSETAPVCAFWVSEIWPCRTYMWEHHSVVIFVGPVILVVRTHLNQWFFRDHQNWVVTTNNNSSWEPLNQNGNSGTTDILFGTTCI